MIKYKLTDQKLQTHAGCQWVVGEWKEAKGKPIQSLCTDAWLHCYDSPLLAVLHNPIHAMVENPRLWEVEVGGKSKNDHGMKRGYQKMRLIREIPLPVISHTQKIVYGILCAKKVYKTESWCKWVDNWLSGVDRSVETAHAARTDAAYVAAYAARTDATYAAARAAAHAADAAARAADAAATYAAARAARAAAHAADAAALAAGAYTINLVQIAEKAMGVVEC